MFPLIVTFRLYRSREKFNLEKFLKIYGIFYIGLKDESFYWEILVVNARKFILIVCATLMVTAQSDIKVSDNA